MPLLINKVTSGSRQVNYNYLDSEFIFAIVYASTYTVDLFDVQFNDDSVLLTGIDALKAAYERKNIVARIGGDEYKNGKITSLSFDQSSASGRTSARFSIEESVRIDDTSSNEFLSYIPNPQWIESLSETYSFNRSNETYSFNRNVSIKWKQSDGLDFLHKASLAIKNFYFNRKPQFGFIEDSISTEALFNAGWKTNKSEEIDLINLSLTFSEDFSSSEISDPVDGVSRKKTYSKAIDQNGFTTTTYTIELKALKEPLEKNIADAVANEIDSLYLDHYPSIPISIEKGINKDGGTANMTVVFTNNPSQNSSNSINYSIAKNKVGTYYEYNVSVNYKSNGAGIEQRFTNVKQSAQSFTPTLKTKINQLFPEAGVNIFEKSVSVSYDRFNGSISQSTIFSTDDSYNASFPLLKFKITKSKTESLPLVEKMLDLGSRQEVITVAEDNVSVEQNSINIMAIMPKSKGIFAGDQYIESLLSTVLPVTYYLQSDNVTIETANGTTNRVINYSTIPA